VFALIGFGVVAYLILKKESRLLWIPLGYFAIMETLQALTYIYIGDCSSPMNQLLTFLSYIHISFQPIFINLIFLYFIPARFRKKIFTVVMILSFLATIFMLAKVYPFDWAGTCNPADAMCAKSLCSIKGSWHIAWHVPLNNLGNGISSYYLAAIILPLIFGSWRAVIYTLIFGPGLAKIISSSPNEWPAIWCLMSIALILVVFIPKARNFFHVRKWYFWEYPRKCGKCKHWWFPKNDKHPMKCPKCKSRYWHK